MVMYVAMKNSKTPPDSIRRSLKKVGFVLSFFMSLCILNVELKYHIVAVLKMPDLYA